MICGLLGKTLGHSYSPQIHSHLGVYEYCLFEKQPEELEEFLKHGNFSGINVTMPYKKDVIPYLDELSPIAQRLGAVNTIVRRNGKLIGHNTDYAGFKSMVQVSGLNANEKKVLVLGSGGASNTAVAVMQDLGANVIVVSRWGDNHYQNLHLHADARIIVNTTPVGMFPHTLQSPVSLSAFPCLEGVLDVVYNPARTQLLMDAEERGIVAMNGLWMLVAQAKESAEWFQNTTIYDEIITEIHSKLKCHVENIVLIGMPGCGKTTVGKALAKQLGRKFIDIDQAVEEDARKPIPEIINEFGEEYFRVLETRMISIFGKESNLIIATGGGCVTKTVNYPLLHQNSTIFWLEREISELPTEGRPLSQKGKLEDLYRIRKPFYKAFADVIIENNSVEQTVQLIMEAIQ